ncbi:MAG: hypothetical protein V1697_01945, partial [Candidatus Levyibacteriota bacterium]
MDNPVIKTPSVFKRLRNYIASATYSRTIGIIGLLIVIAAVPLTVFISQKQQEIRQRAATTCAEYRAPLSTCNALCAQFANRACVYVQTAVNRNTGVETKLYNCCGETTTTTKPGTTTTMTLGCDSNNPSAKNPHNECQSNNQCYVVHSCGVSDCSRSPCTPVTTTTTRAATTTTPGCNGICAASCVNLAKDKIYELIAGTCPDAELPDGGNVSRNVCCGLVASIPTTTTTRPMSCSLCIATNCAAEQASGNAAACISANCPSCDGTTITTSTTTTTRPATTTTTRATTTTTIATTTSTAPPAAGNTILTLDIGLDGIGTVGDNLNSDATDSTQDPLHKTRKLFVSVY